MQPDEESGQLWQVVGGADKGGILVRMDQEVFSQMLDERLATGSLVKQWDLQGDRLQYELVRGSGPPIGWVSTKLKSKELLVKRDRKLAKRLPLGSLLPPIVRGPRCPGGLCVPKASRPTYEKMGLDKPREPRLYVLVFPGAEDQVLNGWLQLECRAPTHLELATYEWPGHGVRKAEPMPGSMQELADDAFEAFKSAMLAGSFIVAGHSIGALLMTLVCERAQRELGAGPEAAFALDRGAPHLAVLSSSGHELLKQAPEKFMSIWQPGMRVDSEAYRMRVSDQILDDDVRPVGFFRYPCKVHVVAAAWTFAREWPPADAAPEWLEAFTQLCRVLQEQPCTGPFSEADYELWSEWAAETELHRLDLHHMELKSSPQWLDLLWKEVESLLRKGQAPPSA